MWLHASRLVFEILISSTRHIKVSCFINMLPTRVAALRRLKIGAIFSASLYIKVFRPYTMLVTPCISQLLTKTLYT